MKWDAGTHHYKNALCMAAMECKNECTKKSAFPNNVGQAPHLEPKESCQNTLHCAGRSNPFCSLPIQSGRVGIRTRVIETAFGRNSDSTPIARRETIFDSRLGFPTVVRTSHSWKSKIQNVWQVVVPPILFEPSSVSMLAHR